MTQSPRETHAKPASACLCDVVAAEGSAVISGPAQRLLSLDFPIAGAKGVA